jgi:hypothetical protein
MPDVFVDFAFFRGTSSYTSESGEAVALRDLLIRVGRRRPHPGEDRHHDEDLPRLEPDRRA